MSDLNENTPTNQDEIDVDEHDEIRATGQSGGGEHPIEGEGENPEAERPDYEPGNQRGVGSG